MARSTRWLIVALSAAVVSGLEDFHAHFIGHYAFTQLPRFAWLVVFIALIWVTTYAVGIPDEVGTAGDALVRAAIAVGTSAGVVSVIALLVAAPLLPRFVVLTSAALLAPLDAAVSVIALRGRRREGVAQRVLAVVEPSEAVTLVSELGRCPEHRALLAATYRTSDVSGMARRASLVELAEADRANVLVLDRVAQADEHVVAQAAMLHGRGVRVRTLSLFYDEWLGKLPVGELERVSLLFDVNELHRSIYPRVKRGLDVAIASPGTLLCLVAAPLVALVNLAANPGPLFFRQQRVGKDGRLLTIVKFRTMPPHAGESRWTVDDDPRVRAWGRLMRRTHLDELPQFFNVLRRDLSVIGPRPEQPRYVEELREKIPYYDLRHVVRPGLTGWAQVKYGYGASELDAYEKLQYDFYYLRHQSLGLDLRIIGRTLRSIVGRQGR